MKYNRHHARVSFTGQSCLIAFARCTVVFSPGHYAAYSAKSEDFIVWRYGTGKELLS